MIADKNRVYDGWTSLEAGVDAGRTPTLLAPNQCASAENMVFRGGHPTTRPGFRKLTEVFKNPDFVYTDSGQRVGDVPGSGQSEGVYRFSIFQSAIGYSPHRGDDCIMAMIGGRLFKIVPGVTDSTVTEIELEERNPYSRPLAYMVQADKWLIVQDGESRPILYDGNVARRSIVTTDREKTEVPCGTIMAYGMGRLVVIVNDRDVAFGDLYGSHEGDDPADSLILFSERNFLGEGFDAAIPFQMGVATGMVFFPQLDTSTGNGQLLVFAERGAASFFLSLPREQWKTSLFQVLALLTTGVRGHRSICVSNEDIWFRSEDGFRAYRQARSESGGWAHIPLSTNVRQFLDSDTPRVLRYASAIYFDNRVIGTCSPVWNQGRPCHEGLVVVDFDILSSFAAPASRPAWDGHWQKQSPLGKSQVRILQLLTGRFNGTTRAFMFGIDELGANQLYEITLDDKDDFDGLIEWELVSRAFDFAKLSQQGSPFSEYELYDGDIWLMEIIE